MPKTSEANLRAIKKYQDKNIRQIKMNFHRTLDADVLDKLDSVPSKQGYIKELIRADIAKQKGE